MAITALLVAAPALAASASARDPLDGSSRQGVGTHRLVSRCADGTPTYLSSVDPAVNGNGRFVAFSSLSTCVDADGGQSGVWQVYLLDRKTGIAELLSRGQGGGFGDGRSSEPTISRDGTKIAYWSEAENLVSGDSNDLPDAFLHDVTSGTTTLVSRTPGGRSGNGWSMHPVVSADGTRVVFDSEAQNLMPGVDRSTRDVFAFDPQTRALSLVSRDLEGEPAYGDSQWPSVSADGRFVSFMSRAPNLVPGDVNFETDIFVRDLELGKTTLVSVSTAGVQTNGISDISAISADGRFVAFETRATNLGYTDVNEWQDVYVRDREAGTTRLVSATPTGETGDRQSVNAVVGVDGVVHFESYATDLVDGDANGRYDIFAYVSPTTALERITLDRDGGDTNGQSHRPALSSSGRYLVYDSSASDIRPDIDYIDYDVFVYRVR